MNRIREIREAASIKQVDLCLHLKWPQSRVSNYETGLRNPGLAEARAIVAALNQLGAACELNDAFPADQQPTAA
jgi:putative transcriptional regulator